MRKAMLAKNDFERIAQHIEMLGVKLLVIDFNGVLDDYYPQKYEFLRSILSKDVNELLPELFLTIEQAYIRDRSATIKQSVEQFFEAKNIPMSDAQRDMLSHRMFEFHLTNDARDFLDSLKVPFIIYTSLSEEQATIALGSTQYELFTRDQYEEDKPSIANLKSIMQRYDVRSHELCVMGDGLIDDLMPASLIGAHTILVSPYADTLQ